MKLLVYSQAFSPAGRHHPQLDLNLLGSEMFAPENRFLFSILGTSVTNKNTNQIL
jgi:hypothetical protein